MNWFNVTTCVQHRYMLDTRQIKILCRWEALNSCSHWIWVNVGSRSNNPNFMLSILDFQKKSKSAHFIICLINALTSWTQGYLNYMKSTIQLQYEVSVLNLSNLLNTDANMDTIYWIWHWNRHVDTNNNLKF